MVLRRYWLDRIMAAWERRPIVWLSGVRRSGKTYLAKCIEAAEYFDCELPRTRRMMEDPEFFLKGIKADRIILDEIHRLDNPSEILKIAADYFPAKRVLATGSSTLGASTKFRDTLAGRKTTVALTPMISDDLIDFQNDDINRRLLYGGLPPFFLSAGGRGEEYQEWIDAYWAKDIQVLFRLERRHSFLKFFELLMIQSGGMFEAAKFAGPCEASRTTISNYLTVLNETQVVHVIRPFTTNKSTEIVAAPKVYGFDTGFICYLRGWDTLREGDFGSMWEHYVLNELTAKIRRGKILYWRDKKGREIDFVIALAGREPNVVECKWSAKNLDPAGILAFRRLYPAGCNYVVSNDVSRSFSREYKGVEVRFISLDELTRQSFI